MKLYIIPGAGSLAVHIALREAEIRYRLLEWLAFINSEIHKGFSPLFTADAGEEVKDCARLRLAKRLSYLQEVVCRPYLLGGHFTVAEVPPAPVPREAGRPDPCGSGVVARSGSFAISPNEIDSWIVTVRLSKASLG